ncbi:TPA: pilus assembly protein [Pseudomonas aeruginosa]|uniref:TraE/TraK family type IV conjugative transfer system protein n=1 Tax=Pseudomonas aeruginosa TaxID=287 RepID=UPI00093AE010|nr:TraE/TraK family type IV conjugative transfer system protein [Pseudomonas aeruginosa]EKF7417596.1 pilus assembly protein [Pseudomonas aeruginosa]MDS9914843.1 TraE/TraK family type IV conjugative transfer system protein [Pseudomonas aeruginosa]HBO1619158.1 pilus assembly protein [Pseudomonas aeruginosa]HCA5864504.1 pilus assembly protein [Pseudomonas aeruginosa]HCA7378636.1 pilus assembly protein [Pseudomonas aeruginosa]
MKLSIFKRNFNGTVSENKFLRISLAGSIFVNFILAIFVGSKDTVVSVTPPTLVESAWVSASQASEEYTESWALYVANTVGNVTPGNSAMIRKTIEPLLDPSIYQDVVNKIESQVHEIRRDRVRISFEAKEILREKNNPNKFFVVGRSLMEGPNGKPERGNTTYEVDLVIRNYKPIITYLTTYEGKPRTEDVIRREEKTQNARKRMEKANHES